MHSTGTATFHFEKPALTPEREDFYRRLASRNMGPLWEVFKLRFPPKPVPQMVPALWRYEDMRPMLMEAGRLLTPEEAERRVLVLENPGLPGTTQITNSLYAGLQLLQPGEKARAHRHAASALRFVVEGSGAYTSVEGERTTMHPGDFILTPSWTWHDHGNPGDEATIWLDGLDMPIVNLLDTPFGEHFPADAQAPAVEEGDSLARYGAGLLPADFVPSRPSSPLFTYPYSRSRASLEQLYRHGPVHPSHGVKLRFVNPATGGYPMPTMAAFLQLLPKAFRGRPYRQTDAAVYCVAEGQGRTQVGDTTFDWQPRDVFVAPSWVPIAHEATEEAVLFSFSDRATQQALGLWREQVPATSN
jgi:gentisate 1,2-dioxygenase